MSKYKCVILISFVVVPEEEGVKLEHTSFIALVKGVNMIQLFSGFVSTHKIVEGKKYLKVLAVRKEHKETRAVVTHVVLLVYPQDCSLNYFLP